MDSYGGRVWDVNSIKLFRFPAVGQPSAPFLRDGLSLSHRWGCAPTRLHFHLHLCLSLSHSLCISLSASFLSLSMSLCLSLSFSLSLALALSLSLSFSLSLSLFLVLSLSLSLFLSFSLALSLSLFSLSSALSASPLPFLASVMKPPVHPQLWIPSGAGYESGYGYCPSPYSTDYRRALRIRTRIRARIRVNGLTTAHNPSAMSVSPKHPVLFSPDY